jgi:hypothetical protein
LISPSEVEELVAERFRAGQTSRDSSLSAQRAQAFSQFEASNSTRFNLAVLIEYEQAWLRREIRALSDAWIYVGMTLLVPLGPWAAAALEKSARELGRHALINFQDALRIIEKRVGVPPARKTVDCKWHAVSGATAGAADQWR